jgi:predicted metal-dependent hydrolase
MSVPYRIRVHRRARHVRLRIDPHQGLLVTVPSAFDQRRIPELIAQKREWIDSVRARQNRLRRQIDPALLGPRPQRIELPAIALTRAIDYRHGDRRTLGFTERDDRLIVDLPRQTSSWIDERLALRLRRWLFERARAFLTPLVDEVARVADLSHRGVTIRNQRTRWGSCSGPGRISLNARLLFASARSCRYVVVHELVHTEYPDHSRRFWNRVAELQPDYRRSMAELEAVWQRLPDWL